MPRLALGLYTFARWLALTGIGFAGLVAVAFSARGWGTTDTSELLLPTLTGRWSVRVLLAATIAILWRYLTKGTPRQRRRAALTTVAVVLVAGAGCDVVGGRSVIAVDANRSVVATRTRSITGVNVYRLFRIEGDASPLLLLRLRGPLPLRASALAVRSAPRVPSAGELIVQRQHVYCLDASNLEDGEDAPVIQFGPLPDDW